jgi:ABC-2 type transport system permease protein
VQASERAAGNIYDLGYRGYGGRRLGRSYAILALYVHSLRSCFGLGRRTSSKIIPITLAILAVVPAAIQLGIASVASGIVEIYRAENYYTFIEVVLALFCAAVAPELVGRDQRNRTLSLYFARAINRRDYAAAKYAALVTAMLILTLGPQTVLFIGNGLAVNDLGGYFEDNLDQFPRYVLSGIWLSLLIAGVGLAVASQTPRRAYSSVGIIALFVVPAPIASIIVNLASGAAHYAIFLSPFHLMEGLTNWIFAAPSDGDLALADQPGVLYGLVALALIGLALLATWRRYERIAA